MKNGINLNDIKKVAEKSNVPVSEIHHVCMYFNGKDSFISVNNAKRVKVK